MIAGGRLALQSCSWTPGGLLEEIVCSGAKHVDEKLGGV